MHSIKRVVLVSMFILINTLLIFSLPKGEEKTQVAIQLKFATGAESNDYYASVGNTLADMWNESFDESAGAVNVETVFSQGTAFGVLDMRKDGDTEKNKVDITIAPANLVYDIREGKGRFGNNKYAGVRLLIPLWIEYSHFIITKKSKIKRVLDMKGKRINVGVNGTRSEYNAIKMLEIIGGIKRDKIVDKHYPLDKVYEALLNERLDVVYIEGGVPISMATTILEDEKYNLLNISKRVYEEKFQDEQGYGHFEIPINTYPFQGASIASVGVKVLLVVDEDVPDEIVFTLLKVYFENLDTIQQEYITMRSFDIKTMYETVPAIPLHQGAVAYLKENGFVISKRFIESEEEEEKSRR